MESSAVPDAARVDIQIRRQRQLKRSVNFVRSDENTYLSFVPLDDVDFGNAESCKITLRTTAGTTIRNFKLGAGAYGGHIDGVSDYALVGWVAPLTNEPPGQIELLVDGIAVSDGVAKYFRRDLAQLNPSLSWTGFALPLPANALDGRTHRLAIRVGNTTIDFGPWTADPVFHVDAVVPLTGWFFDRAAADTRATMHLKEGVYDRGQLSTERRGDVEAIHSRKYSRFSFTNVSVGHGFDLVSGHGSGTMLIGHIVDPQIYHVNALRLAARQILVSNLAPTPSAKRRYDVARRITGEARSQKSEDFIFIPKTVNDIHPEIVANADKFDVIRSICILVPAYNGIDDLEKCITSVLPELRNGIVRLLIINDASPDEAVGKFLEDLGAQSIDGLSIITNEKNMGFVKTVNKGIRLLDPDEDVVLLNADTLIAPGTVEKLRSVCYSRPGVASVTPMSNNATILSFPSSPSANKPIFNLPVEIVDAEFEGCSRELGSASVEIPTAVGFCMYIARSALNEVGSLAEEWGRGYCEEVDWCLKARDLGWVHLCAINTYVVHEGSVSFGIQEREDILAVNHVKLNEKYPEYLGEVGHFIRRDPIALIRAKVFTELLAKSVDRLTIHLMHGLGGGTQRYVDDIRCLPRNKRHEFMVLTPVLGSSQREMVEMRFDQSMIRLSMKSVDALNLFHRLTDSGCSIDIQINSRLGFHSEFIESISTSSWPYVIMLHDYQWYCPRVHLYNHNKFYCGEPSKEVCKLCVTGPTEYDFGDQNEQIGYDFDGWLSFNTKILAAAATIVAPSRDAADRYQRRFNMSDIRVVPHPERQTHMSARVLERDPFGEGVVTIAVVGAIYKHKGYSLLLRVIEAAARSQKQVIFHIVGHTEDDDRLQRFGNAVVHGKYNAAKIGKILVKINPDFVFLASVWPETYSYVLSEIWDTGYPVVAFDFGAPAERIRRSGGGVLITPTSSADQVLEALMRSVSQLSGVVVPSQNSQSYRDFNAYWKAVRE